MRHTISTGTFTAAIALITATRLLAQAPTAQQQPTQSEPKMVVTGCLRAAPSADTAGTSGTTRAPGTTGTTGTAGATPAPATGATAEQKFVLMDATAVAESSAAASAPDAATAASAGQTYKLIANSSALAPHTGKKLELTGTIEPPNASQAADGTSGGATLRVTSGKVLAESCDKK